MFLQSDYRFALWFLSLVVRHGFGLSTGARSLAEIDDPARFESGAILPHIGLAPVDRQSGKTHNSSSRSRGGNHQLKNAMFIAVFVASQHDPIARAYYERKRREGKGHNAAFICVGRRRCVLVLVLVLVLAMRGTAKPPQEACEKSSKAA